MNKENWMEQISRQLAAYPVASLPPKGDQRPAAVALLIREAELGPELFFIQRALHPDDPWSGNIGFPGGRFDSTDLGLQHTAERETREEVGFDLAAARYLGRLADVVGTNLPVQVSCFVYGIEGTCLPRLSDEVHDTFWIGLSHLADLSRHREVEICFGVRKIRTWCFDPQLPGKPLLWGLTYRLVLQFVELVCGKKPVEPHFEFE